VNRKNVKILMIQHDIKIPELARELEVTPQAIYFVITGRMNSKRIQEKLEEAFGLSIEQIRTAWNTITPTPSRPRGNGGKHAMAAAV